MSTPTQQEQEHEQPAVSLDLGLEVGALTAALVDIPSVSGAERPLADAVERELRALPRLRVDRHGNNLVARTGFGDNRIHGKTWALLRLTRMPAVRVELGYLTSTSDRAKLCDARYRDTIAEGLLVAVQRLYLPTADDPPTGVMRIA